MQRLAHGAAAGNITSDGSRSMTALVLLRAVRAETMGADTYLEKRIRELEEAVRTLQEENHQLRCAARAFGDLAERLSLSLDAERRQAADRRRIPRWTDDRRRSDSDHDECC